MLDVVGGKYGRLLILKQWHKKGHLCVLAECDCRVLKEYDFYSLKSGHTKSCGCLRRENAQREIHGKHGSPIYHSWAGMIQRCTNPKDSRHKHYGARGIKVCDRWLKFENFYEDMGDRPEGLELDRIDNNQGYFKENCRWTTSRKNNQNKRNSKYWFINGVRYESISDAVIALGLTDMTVVRWCNGRFRNGKFQPPKDGCYSELKYK